MAACLLTACAGDEDVLRHERVTLSIPIAVCESDPSVQLSDVQTRTTGDPGLKENLPAPQYLYVWVDMVDGTDAHSIVYYNENNIAKSSWAEKNDVQHRWEYVTAVQLPDEVVPKDGTTLQVYAIASQNDLSTAVTALNTSIGIAGLVSQVEYSDARLTTLKGATFDLSAWESTTAAAHSLALGNLYSTPLALVGTGNVDAAAIGIADDGLVHHELLHNGTYTVVNDASGTSLEGDHPTRLYHCAAKADYKWEVDESLIPGVTIRSLTLSGLPTQLRVFEPTHNPSGATTCPLLAASGAVNALTPGNQWIGREYAYVLQPPTTTSSADGQIPYNVTFAGRTPAEKNNVSSTTLPATNPVFTTWYRINADIK